MASLSAQSAQFPAWRAWLLAARLRTLPVAAAPVAVGTALAFAEGSGRSLPAAVALLGALLIQVGANLANDAFDFERGADTDARVGPPRAAQLGLLSPRELKLGTAAVFAAAVAVGGYLVAIAGWPIALLGLLCIAAGLGYTGGPFAFGYHGLGDLAVFVFFGIAAVCGTYYVQALQLPPLVILASFPVGAFATAVLVVNNLRDIETDRVAGKRTLAVRFGARAARFEYAALIGFAYLMLPLLWRAGASPLAALLPLVSLPVAAWLVRTVAKSSDGPTLNAVLARTAAAEVGFALLLAAGLLM